MKNKGKMVLRTQLIITFTALLILVIVFISVYVYNSMFNIVIKNTEDSTLNNLKQIENNIIRFQSGVENILYSSYLNSDIRTFVRSGYDCTLEGVTVQSRIISHFDNLTAVNTQIGSLFIENSSGVTIGSQNDFIYNSKDEIKLNLEDSTIGLREPFWQIVDKNLYHSASKQIENGYNISVTKSFSGIGRDNTAKITAFIDSNKFSGLFKNYENRNSSLYIYCDGIYKIHWDRIEKAENKPLYYEKMPRDKSGSFIHRAADEDLQIIFNRIANTTWIIIEEIPLKQYAQQSAFIGRDIAITMTISIFLAIILSILFIRKITTPMETLTKAMEETKDGKLGYQIDEQYHNEFDKLISYFNSMSISVKNLVHENKEIEKQKRNYAISVLKSQINPHFMFNTLNMIKWMAISQNSNNISDSLEMLMTLLRPVFKENNNYCKLSEEIEYANNYIQLINLRFGRKTTLIANINSSIMEQKVLRFVTQPFIENCVKYCQNDNHDVIICLSVQIDEAVTILINDNGAGIDEATLTEIRSKLLSNQIESIENGDMIGIANVHARLKLSYGSEYGVSVNSVVDEGTTVLIRLPKI